MKRYLVFGFEFHYSNGGIEDLIMTTDDVDEIDDMLCDDNEELDLWQIVDTEQGEVYTVDKYEKEHLVEDGYLNCEYLTDNI